MSKAILYDATMCIGCKACESACAEQNHLPYDDTVAAESEQSAHKYTVVKTMDDKFMRRLCMHCEKPACASACPVGAFHKTAAGPVVYDVWKCIGCRYCMVACAFNQPKYEFRRLLLNAIFESLCPFHDFFIGRAQLQAHAVERSSQIAHLVVGLHFKLISKFATGKMFGAMLERGNGEIDHAPHKQPAQYGDDQHRARCVIEHAGAAHSELHVGFRQREIGVKHAQDLLVRRMRVAIGV